MENSEELRRVIERFFDAVRDGDEQAVTNRISRQPGFERFGSDPDEWWRDGEQAALIWRQQMREIGGGYIWRRVNDVYALTEGTVGWGSFLAEFDSPEEPSRSG